jgi:hypothetical protein
VPPYELKCTDAACCLFPDTIAYSSFSMELCTASVSSLPHRSHIPTFSRPLPCHRYAGSRSWVSKRRRQSSLYVMNAASTRVLPSSRGIGQPAQTNGAALNNQKNSALEQLDIERGVCIPFRKYSPEMVWSTRSILFCVYKIGLLNYFVIMPTSVIARSGIKCWDQVALYCPSLVEGWRLFGNWGFTGLLSCMTTWLDGMKKSFRSVPTSSAIFCVISGRHS